MLPKSYSQDEHANLNATAQQLVDDHPRVIDLLARGAAINPDGEAIVYLRAAGDEAPPTMTYNELMGYLAAAMDWYRRRGIGPTDSVAILVPSSAATIIALWAGTGVGIANPLNLLFSREAIAAQLRAARVKILFAPPPGMPGGLYEKVAGLENEIETLEKIAVLPLDGSIAFDGETLTPDPDWRTKIGAAAPGEANRVAAMLPTGGTTGHPKIVQLTQRNMVASSIGSMLSLGNTKNDRVMVALPLFHVGGAFVGTLAAQATGATVVIPTALGARNPDVVANFWRLLERWKITFGGLVPTSLGAVAGVPVNGADLSRLRIMVTGASTCPPEIERRFLDAWGRGDAVRQVYGMTEFAGAITQVPFDKAPDGAAVGLPVALAEVAVLAGGKIHHGPSPMGELLARGPQVFAGYVDAKQNEGTFHEGWLRTGDLCRIEDSGQVLVTGRIKDLIIRGGHNIDPAMIEDVALRFPGVSLAAAVGLPDPYAGEVPMLFVAAAPGTPLDADALAAFMTENVAEAPARPKAIHVIAEIPLTPVGKIFKPRLRELAAEQAVRQLAATVSGVAVHEVSAVTDPARGLVIRVVVDGDAAARATLTRTLGQLPLAIDVEQTTTSYKKQNNEVA